MATNIDFSLPLQTQRLREQLAAAEKKIQEYETLIATLYNNLCESCRGNSRRIAGASLVSSPVSGAVETSFALSSSTPTPTEPTWRRVLRAPLVSLSWASRGGHVPTASPSGSSRLTVSEFAASSRPDQSCALSASKVPASPPDTKPTRAHSMVKYNSNAALKVELEHVWIHEAAVPRVKFSPDGRYLAAGESDQGETHIYDIKTRKRIRVLADVYTLADPSLKDRPWIWGLSYSPDGRYLTTDLSDGRIMIWRVGEGHGRSAFRGHKDLITCVDFSPDSRSVASSSYDQTVRIWSMRDGSSKVLEDVAHFFAVKFSPDGKYIAASDFDGIIRIWNVRTRKLVQKWKAHDDRIRGIVFTPEGKGLVTCSWDKTLKYWDVSQSALHDLGRILDCEKEFVGHTERVNAVAISPDAKWVLSGSYDGTARIWAMDDASVQCVLHGHTDTIYSVDFSLAGCYLVSGSLDGKIMLWKYESVCHVQPNSNAN